MVGVPCVACVLECGLECGLEEAEAVAEFEFVVPFAVVV